MGADFKVGLYKEIQSHVGVYGNVVKDQTTWLLSNKDCHYQLPSASGITLQALIQKFKDGKVCNLKLHLISR